MDFNITQGIAVLERTPGTLHGMLHDLDTAWLDANEGPETWSPYVVVGHLVHGERVGDVGRARLGTYRTNRPRDGETVSGRNRAVARVLAHRGPIR